METNEKSPQKCAERAQKESENLQSSGKVDNFAKILVSIRQTPSCKCHEVFSENFGDSQRYL